MLGKVAKKMRSERKRIRNETHNAGSRRSEDAKRRHKGGESFVSEEAVLAMVGRGCSFGVVRRRLRCFMIAPLGTSLGGEV